MLARKSKFRRAKRRRAVRAVGWFEQLEPRRMLHGDDVGPDPALAEGEADGPPALDFSLLDVNSNSPTFNQQVSPRDYLQQVSAWYFGHAT